MREIKGEIAMALYELKTYTLHVGKFERLGAEPWAIIL